MKYYSLIIVAIMSLVLLNSCSRTPKQKLDDEKAGVIEARHDAMETASESRVDRQNFWHHAKDNFAANDKIIKEYKVKMTDAKGKLKTEYDKKIDELDKKNEELKAKLNQYQDTGDSTWDLFKREFDHDMDKLETALKDFTIINKK